MDKPITLVRSDFIKDIANVINNSGLPAFVIEPILKNFLDEVRIVMNQQYENDKIQYEKFISQNDAAQKDDTQKNEKG